MTMARYGMRKPMGRRLTEPGSRRYIDGGRKPRVAVTGWTGWTGRKYEPPCGNQQCSCNHTDHAECDPLGCLPF